MQYLAVFFNNILNDYYFYIYGRPFICSEDLIDRGEEDCIFGQ